MALAKSFGISQGWPLAPGQATPTVIPAPIYTTLPAISPASGAVGTTFTATNGIASNATSYARRWLLSGTAIGTGTTITVQSAGTLIREETATGPGGAVTVQSAPVDVSAIVTPTPTPITISGTPPTTGQVGQAYSFTPTTANGSGTKTFAIASGVLLGGLSFSTTTGAITGSPTVAGTISGLSISVTDSTGTAATAPVNVTIAAAPPVSGPQPKTQPTLVDNGDGTYTVTPATYDNPQPTISGKSKRRSGTGGMTTVSGLSGNTISGAAADGGSWIDYVEVATLNGVSATVASNGFVVPVPVSTVLDTSYTGAETPVLTVFPALSAKSGGSSADLAKTGARTGATAKANIVGRSLSGPVFLTLDMGSPNASHSFRFVFDDAQRVVWDYVDPNNYAYAEVASNFIVMHTVISSADTVPSGGQWTRNVGYPAPGSGKSIKVALDAQNVYFTYQNASGVDQTQIMPRPPMPTTTTVSGIRIPSGYTEIDNWVPQSSQVRFTVTGMSVAVDGALTATGTYQGSAPPGFAIEEVDDRGVLVQDWTALTSVSISGGAFTVRTSAADGRNPLLTGRACRFRFRATDDTTKTFAFGFAVPGYVAPRAAVFGANLAGYDQGLLPYASVRLVGNAFQQGYYQDTANNFAVVRQGSSAKLDADGWPLSSDLIRQIALPPVSGATEVITWDGAASVTVLQTTEGSAVISEKQALSANSYSYKTVFDHNVRSNQFLGIKFSGAPKNIRISPSGASRTSFWDSAYVELQKPVNIGYSGPIRFMDLRNTNGNGTVDMTWAMRASADTLEFGVDGLPIERLIELTNVTGRDPWITLPEQCTDDYAQQVAIALTSGANLSQGKPWSSGVDPARTIYVELGNEVWNYSFQSVTENKRRYALRTGEAEKADNAGGVEQSFKQHAYRHKRVVQAIKAAVPNWSGRIVFVLGSNLGGYLYDIVYGEIGGEHIDAVAIAPYIQVLSSEIAALSDHTPSTLEPVYKQRALDVLQSQVSVKTRATSRNHRLICYEGGCDFAVASPSLTNGEIGDFRSSQSFYRVNYTYLKTWKDSFGDVYVHFQDITKALNISQYQWGLQLYQGQPDPIYGKQAVQDVIAGVASRY